LHGLGDVQLIFVVNNQGGLEAADAPLSVVLNGIPFLEGRRVGVDLALLPLVQGHKLIVRKNEVTPVTFSIFIA
jgi:hypothetical protein